MSTFQDQINATPILALAVTKTRGLVGRLRVQKLMYLLQQKGVRVLEPLFYEYHHFGPFSSDVVDILKGAVRSDIVKENEDRDDDDGWKRYEYLPARNAEAWASRVAPEDRVLVERVLDVCRGAHWRTLELAATADFLQRADKTDRDTAFQDALERKPKCVPYESQARRLLEQLELP